MGKSIKSTTCVAAGLVIGLALAGCTTPASNTQGLYDEALVRPNSSDKWEQIDRLSRLELADIATSVYVAAPRLNTARSAPSPYFSTVSDHERGYEERSNDDVRKTRNLRFSNYEADKFESINNEIPPGFEVNDVGFKHTQSGMICPFNLTTEDDTFSLEITNIRLYNQESTDVSCDFKTSSGGIISLYSSYWPDISQEEHATGADKLIRDRFNTTKALEVPIAAFDDYNPATMGTATASGYDISEPNSLQKMKSSLWVVKTRDWHVKVRATYLMNDKLTELYAAVMHNRTQIDVYNNSSRVVGEIDV